MKKILAFALVCVLYSCNNDDDSTVDVCDDVTNIVVSNVTSNSATITWDDLDAVNSFELEYGISGFTIGTGSMLTATSSTANILNLESMTTYDVYVKAICSANNSSMYSNVISFTTDTPLVIPEFRQNLSELNLFSGDLSDLNITPRAFKYELSTELFSDYAHKQRLVALPEGTTMSYDGDGLPIFPDNTVIAKTFYYNTDERDLSLGRTIIETRLLIKINGAWETGDYKWNDEQTEAVLDLNGSVVPVTWIDRNGDTNAIDYQIPSNTDCFTCHSSYDIATPIGPKLRSMNFLINGTNQIDQFISNGQLTGVASSDDIRVLPNWEDSESFSLEERARAYMDINCAHCHISGGSCEDESILNFAYETELEETNIENQTFLIEYRVTADVDGIRMPFIGTTILHAEGVELILDYIDTLE